ncbi:Cys-tRNA(Pro) deacylase [Pediococcus pentosaceus]|uniref:Cys-tRNA(Pro)/Cys-tRNA(Cys) deacylase n=1 Tax=Pediococcus pentosaceus TaxID=1255 RepID=A0ABD7X8P8_PEDPE|nr:Cys-tRNA(Pro) deacylase [Pediococcus pentosaceus]MBF7111604.1 Cys-tRNA(Pro) deacylase [Pediococcus pentosaceus]MBF7116949.1 Cys-tRNA(Pro) deacylase [Pediococcus pentosaceus]MBF7118691.1 Cys-tRNA(Pro) deacylase [Pediococcus pentosaceus]MCV3329268.1 Cys-tRNA(Pro) deacylase [Pediococcus pentosaceus]MDE7511265.1 Cys-tRNA(Pro) deacylase [Pediococcus pentosaceus]
MMGKKKKEKVSKTLVEQILDKNKIKYKQFIFPTFQDGDVKQLNVDHIGVDDHLIYKTLALIGNKTGPIVGVLPVDEHLSYKKLAKISGNKKVGMIPLKDLIATTGYEHGANTPIGIYETKHFPIYISDIAKEQGTIIVSSGKIGRSVQLKAEDLAQLVHGTFGDIIE